MSKTPLGPAVAPSTAAVAAARSSAAEAIARMFTCECDFNDFCLHPSRNSKLDDDAGVPPSATTSSWRVPVLFHARM
eukprot:CAMPEP_0181377406 /NCGR_PEP_ID=MMETSP1106-20121128/17881_1 /TAXON_ID=81844 /ORGANISM="Mantoniella antarctica, Strain SL-175" /LENGTH=76 /DNA_ID=CAMNT_0023496141 /DNA_START=506 /DNA_END=736 /DNA_ORIENTATION=-